MLAHQGAADESLAIVLITTGLWAGWIGWSRFRGNGFPRLPKVAAGGLLVVATGLMIASATIPPALFPPNASSTPSATPSGPRPSSTATLAIETPANGSTATGDNLEVVLDLQGGRVVDTTSTQLSPDTGHIHLSIDGTLVSMTYGTVQIVDVRGLAPGIHRLVAEFVANDHGPFDPRVMAAVAFETGR